jgi:serine/threonine protein kinase
MVMTAQSGGAANAPSKQGDKARPTLGRFRLLRGLGEGAQATVWLAHDPRLDREVALKLLRPDTDTVSLDEWLHEARAVSRLTHPNIVPVFEADNIDGQCYLVFEYVPGQTLADLMRGHKRVPAREAVELALGVLAGLQAAHEAGVVHRDLKPSNILIDASGRPRVMDFGIAARMADAAQPQLIVGTPGYISPEAARGEPPSAVMDVFAASILLAEMLAGQRLNFDTDPWRAVRRVIDEDLKLPAELGTEVDDTLRAIVKRGLARNAAERWPTAQALHDALLHWLHPAATQVAPVKDGAALEFLLRRMRNKSDFPAMSDAVGRIQKLTYSENASLAGLSNEILKDVALTQKLLRLVNTVHYKHAGGGNITTVSRAVALVGFAGIRNMALSLILLEHMENKTHAQQLRVEFLRSLMAANLARELCLNPRDDEESFLCAMFHNLGRTLTEFYFPEEAQQIRRITRVEHKSHGHGVTATPLSIANASAQVLGMSFEQLGLGVARQWGLPKTLQQSMHHVEGEPPAHPPEQQVDRQRWLAHAANAVADEILQTDPAEVHGHVRAIAQRYAHALGVKPGAFDTAATEARQELSKMARAMNINLPRNSPGQRLLSPVEPALDDSLTPTQLQATQVLASADQATAKLDRQEAGGESTNEATRKINRETQREASDAHLHDEAVQVLASGIEDITNQLVDNFKLNEVLRMVLETLYRGLHFRRVVFCLREPKLDSLTGRFGLGDDIEPAKGLVAAFKIPLHTAASASVDLFAAVCQRGVDTLIADATEHKIAERLPDWYRAKVHAPTFLLLPLAMKGATFALIYADKGHPNSIELSERELSLLRTLRNQAVMAFKQTG